MTTLSTTSIRYAVATRALIHRRIDAHHNGRDDCTAVENDRRVPTARDEKAVDADAIAAPSHWHFHSIKQSEKMSAMATSRRRTSRNCLVALVMLLAATALALDGAQSGEPLGYLEAIHLCSANVRLAVWVGEITYEPGFNRPCRS